MIGLPEGIGCVRRGGRADEVEQELAGAVQDHTAARNRQHIEVAARAVGRVGRQVPHVGAAAAQVDSAAHRESAGALAGSDAAAGER